MSKDLDDLEFATRTKAKKAFELMDKMLKDLGFDGVGIVETKRSLPVQMAYYARGRMAVADVKAMYAAAGLYNITTEEAEKKNTWTLKSNHLSGHAVDFCPIKNGKYDWNVDVSIWEELGKIGESCGLKWGGRWTQKDYPHFEG